MSHANHSDRTNRARRSARFLFLVMLVSSMSAVLGSTASGALVAASHAAPHAAPHATSRLADRSLARATTVCRPTDLFCDDFNGTTLDASKWTPNWLGGSGPVNGAESACYDPSHVTVHDGMLDLRITAQQSSCKGATRPETTGIVTTSGKFLTPATNYRITWRAYFPPALNGAPANWSVVWDDGVCTWPNCGESDVAEVLGGGINGSNGSVCFHYHSSSGGPGNCPSGNYSGWHAFREDVVGGTVSYRYDGHLVGMLAATQQRHYLVAGEQGSGSVGGPRRDEVSELIRSVKVRAL